MPFCVVKGHLLTCKRACFAMQKGVFYNPLCNLLIMRRLQSRFLMIMSWFANNNTLQFVRVFQKPLPDPLRREREDNKRDSPLCLKRYNWVFKSFSRLTLRLKSKRFACYKLRIYELTDRWFAGYKLRIYEMRDRLIANDNYEFTNWQVDGLHVTICDFMSKK